MLKELIELRSSRYECDEIWGWIISTAEEKGYNVHVEELEHKAWGKTQPIKMLNIFVTKGESETYPTFACHTDTVHDIPKGTVHAYKIDDVWFAVEKNGSSIKQIGTQGDCHSGIYGCFQMLERLPAAKAMFMGFEESGLVGAHGSEYVREFCQNSRWIIEIDRQYNDDMVVATGTTNRIASQEFEDMLAEKGAEFGYKICKTGGGTDVVALANDRKVSVSAANFSCGYWNPHSAQETINETDLNNCLSLIEKIAREATDVYPFVQLEKKSYSPKPTKQPKANRATAYCRECSRFLIGDEVVFCLPCYLALFCLNNNKQNCDICGEKSVSKICVSCQYCIYCKKAKLTERESYTTGVCSTCLDTSYLCMDCDSDLKSLAEFQDGRCKVCQDLEVEMIGGRNEARKLV